MFERIAHAGEIHQTPTDATAHALTDWYVALPLFALTVIVVTMSAYFLGGKSRSLAGMALLSVLLVGGISTYSVAPVVSTLALALGFGLALLQMLLGFIKPK